MKKIIIMLLAFICITGCSGNTKTKKSYQEITYDEYMEKIENNDTFVLFMWQTGCSHCEEFEPTLKNVISEYELSDVYALNLAELTDEQYAKIKNKTFVSGTPTTIYVKEGVTQTSPKVIGNKDEETVIKFFQNIDYIKED